MTTCRVLYLSDSPGSTQICWEFSPTVACQIDTYTCTYTFTNTYTYTYAYMYMFIYIYIYICMYMYIYIYTHTHTHTHTGCKRNGRSSGGTGGSALSVSDWNAWSTGFKFSKVSSLFSLLCKLLHRWLLRIFYTDGLIVVLPESMHNILEIPLWLRNR